MDFTRMGHIEDLKFNHTFIFKTSASPAFSLIKKDECSSLA